MRYSSPLYTTRRHNVLKNKKKSTFLSWFWVVLIIIILGLLIGFSNLNAQSLLIGFLISLYRISVAYIISILIAIIVALIITANKVLENLFLPILDVLQSFPSFALFPVLVIALRNSPELVIISVLVISMVWPILFSIIGGVKNRREDKEEAATIFGAVGWKRLVYFTIPELLPSIVTGSIVGWGEGWEFIIGAELLIKTNIGIGYYLGFLGENHENLSLAFGITVLLFLLFIVNKMIWLPLLEKTTIYSSDS